MAFDPIYINNDHLIKLDAFKNEDTAAFLNAATVTVTIYDSTGIAVTGITWPLTMPYIAASDGNYKAIVDKAISLILGDNYKAVITALEGLVDGEWTLYLRAKERPRAS